MPPKFVCSLCMRRFKRESALKDHLESDAHKEMVRKKEAEEKAKREAAKKRADVVRCKLDEMQAG